MDKYFITLKQMVDQLQLEVLYTPRDIANCHIFSPEVNRPGLLITGYHDFFDPSRIQIIGRMEVSYLGSLTESERRSRLHTLMQQKVPVVVITRGQEVFDEFLEFAAVYEVPVLRSAETTSVTMASIIQMLGAEMAPRISRHGVLVEVYGEGLLITGESGIGKSETAIELVKRGHRIIADDMVELRRISNRVLVGRSPENIRHFVELRGIGIINVAKVFGMGAVKESQEVDLVVELQPWDSEKHYSRTGLEKETIEYLGVEIPLSVVPIRPGRNSAIIMEIAAINNRQKKLGYNAAEELMNQLGLEI
ncbi:HPr(Ser) kinase/phosphatase [Ruminococcaceae bacterium OttesenSCG-928-N02]|nr:HPr(Ser) kinase/phosphatase [Ruminococcaceae bacterium OttesenSCG-928-N02]